MDNYKILLTEYYRKYLNREPDTEGFSHYLSLLEKGELNEEKLKNEFINSSEYKIVQLTLEYNQQSKIKIQKNDKIFFVNSSQLNHFWAQLQLNLWESNTFKIFDTFLDSNHSYIDLGAWIGPTVLYGCQKAKFCYAIEPDPVAFKQLKNNVNLNPNLISRISFSNSCVTDSSGITYLTTKGEFGDSCSSATFKKSSKSIRVSSTTLQQFFLDNSIADCNFIKIDIEGGEFSVLPNMSKLLEEEKPTLHISLHPGLMENPKESMRQIYDIICKYDFLYDNKLQEMKQDYILDVNDFGVHNWFDIVVTMKQLEQK